MMSQNQECPKIAEKIGVPNLYFKREDMHPSGSHKGRSIPSMIDSYITQGFKKFSISSSGNAAIAAGQHVQKINASQSEKISLDIYIGRHVPEEKKTALTSLTDEYISVTEKERPLQAFLESIKLSGIKGLRQSADDLALTGYGSLAQELLQIPNLEAVFIATSSGTAAEALGDYFIKNKKNVAIYIVQTSSCHPIAKYFDMNENPHEKSIAGAIVDKVAFRREKVIDIIKKTEGSGLIVSNSEISRAQDVLKEQNITASPNGALSLAGLIRAHNKGKRFSGSVACIIGGK